MKIDSETRAATATGTVMILNTPIRRPDQATSMMDGGALLLIGQLLISP